MRKLVLVALVLGSVGAAPAALACDPRGGGASVEIVIVSDAASQQSQTFLAEATLLDGKATTEESASATVLLSARTLRRKATAIRAQASQASDASRLALVVRAERLEADAAANEAASVTFLARAKLIRTRAKALRALSSRVLASGAAVTAQVLARVQLPAPPANHPEKMPLRALDAAPKVMARPTVVAGI
jgi:hypothetical protein